MRCEMRGWTSAKMRGWTPAKTLSHRERVAAKRPGEGLRRSWMAARYKHGEDRKVLPAFPRSGRTPIAQNRNFGRRPSLARASRSKAGRLEVPATDADRRSCCGFRLHRGEADNRSRRQAAFRANREGLRANEGNRDRRLFRVAIQQRRRLRPPALGDRGSSSDFGRSTTGADTTIPSSSRLTAFVASPHPSPSATPSPYGRGELQGIAHV